MMLGGVPISVVKPPSSDPKAKGIRTVEGEFPARLASRTGDRHQQGEGAYVVHEAGHHRHASGEQRHLLSGRLTKPGQPARQLVDKAGVLQVHG